MIFKLIVSFILLASSLFPQWEPLNGPDGGTVQTFAVSDNIILAGMRPGGVYLSTDNGETWSPKNNGLLNGQVYKLFISGNVFFAGTEAGLYRSTDNGDNWQYLGGQVSGWNYGMVKCAEKLYTATFNGLKRSTDNGASWSHVNINASFSILRAIASQDSVIVVASHAQQMCISKDFGNTWTEIGSGLLNDNVETMLFWGNELFVGYDEEGVHKSTDYGVTWINTNPGLASTEISYLTVKGNKIYAGTENGVYANDNSGSSWVQLNTTGLASLNIYTLASNSNRIFVGVSFHGVHILSDSSDTWVQSNSGIKALEVNKILIDNGKIYAGTNMYGLWVSGDAGLSWQKITGGLELNSVLSIYRADQFLFCGGNETGIFRSSDNGYNWLKLMSGVFRKTMDFLYFRNTMFATNDVSKVIYSDDFFLTYTYVGGSPHAETFAVIDSIIFASSEKGVLKSSDNGISWVLSGPIAGDLRIFKVAANRNRLFAASYSGLYKSDDLGNSWTKISAIPSVIVRSVYSAGDLILASPSKSGVYISYNNGDTWYEKGLRYLDILSFAHDSANVYAGTLGGWIHKIPRAGIFPVTMGLGVDYFYQTSPVPIPRQNWPFGAFYFNAVTAGNTFNSLKLYLSGAYTGINSDAPFRLYMAGTNDFSQAVPVDTDKAPVNGVLSFDNLNIPLLPGKNYFWITADIDDGATGSIRAAINGPGDLTVTGLNSAIYKYGYLNFGWSVNLPVELTSFSAAINKESVDLTWMTATEKENLGFRIERSDAKTDSEWENIGFVEGRGTTSLPQNYSFSDMSPLKGKNFYRLRQIDYNNYYSVSKTVEIDFLPVFDFSLSQNYPNPFNPATMIRYSSPVSSRVTLKVFDILGNEVATLVDEEKQPGNYEVEFNAAKLPSGIYFYQLRTGSFADTKKMIFLK